MSHHRFNTLWWASIIEGSPGVSACL